MCGIAGILASGRADVAGVRVMLDVLRHRGPDDEGLVAISAGLAATPLAGPDTPAACRAREPGFLPGGDDDPNGPSDVVLGSRRLAILDLSPLGHQPMCSHDRGTWIVHNGEIYNYLELREQLRGLGHRFLGGSDTEVALAAYREWGTDCFDRFNGMWATAIWDEDRRTLLLSRDRFGVKPLYVADVPGGIAFASEIKALLAVGVETRPNDAVLRAYLDTGRIDAIPGETAFAAVRQVQPGTLLECPLDGTPRCRRWYRLEPHPSPAEADLLPVLEDAVALRLRSDVPVGSCLSGGLDSSAVVALARRQLPLDAPLHTFTYSAADAALDERGWAARVAAATAADAAFAFEPAADLPGLLATVVAEQDEPIGSASVIAQRQVMALARERNVTVILDGQGGDEVLAGYKYYLGARLGDLLAQRRFAAWARELGASRTIGLESARWLLRASVGELRRRHGAERVRARQLEDVRDHLPSLLHYEDRSSMAFSIETRLPFLDYRVVELALALPAETKVSNGWTKLALRRAVDGVLPADVAWRKDKVQFTAPQATWLEGPLRELRNDLFASSSFASRPGVDAEAVRSSTDDGVVWRHLALELWYRAYVDAPAS